MLPQPSLNQSITAAWNVAASSSSAAGGAGTAVARKRRKPVSLNASSPAPSPTAGPSAQAQPTTDSPQPVRKKRRPAPGGTGMIADKYAPPDCKLSALGGLEAQITQMMEIVALPLLHPEIYEHTGVPRPKGVLLHGVPGGGKTQLVKCLAGELGLPFISVSAPSIVSGMSGESEKTLRDTFDEAKKLAPCLLFLDEVDAITPKRETAQREMERRIVAQLLTCIDELAASERPVVMIGATNRPDSLDPALRRAGRFDHEIEMGVPTLEGREQILRVLCAPLRLSGEIDFRDLAKATPGYVGADLTALTTEAGVVAVKRIFESADGREVVQKLMEERVEEMAIDDVEAEAESRAPSEKGAEASEALVIGDEQAQAAVDGDAGATGGVEAVEIEADADPEPAPVTRRDAPFSSLPPSLLHTPIARFLTSHPSPLTASQLSAIALVPADFAAALKIVQPSAKREGFATVPDVSWADVGALGSVRDELALAVVHPIRNPELFGAVGIDAPAGVLLWGPPGCGKTLLAKAVANESRANFISVKGPELLNKYVGESERAVRQVFARARASSPCVIFFDELDALVPRRDDSMSESSARVVNTLLTELDGLDARKAVYVIGATNRPDMIDPAMVRPGRLDKLLYVDLPSAAERVDILRTHTARARTPIPPADWDGIAALVAGDRCDGYSGADVAALVREAATLALRAALRLVALNDTPTAPPAAAQDRPNVEVCASHFVEAAVKTRASVSREQRAKYERMRDRYAGVPAKGRRVKDEEAEA
ncbi:Ribosome biogenesis ATPase rix7 [Cryptotrichosporon argae]